MGKTIKIDACNLACPAPILKVSKNMPNLSDGDIMEVQATDPGFESDIRAWSERTDNQLLDIKKDGRVLTARIEKGKAPKAAEVEKAAKVKTKKKKVLVVLSGDLDKVMASLIIANGAVSMGYPVSMFFTFWGLNVLRKPEYVPVEKTPMEQMFGLMMPRGAGALKLSKMNMGGLGTLMMKQVMKGHNVLSVEELLKEAMENGVKLVACQMTMDIMGIKKEELLDEVEIGGVASMLSDAEESNVNFFFS